MPFNFNCRARCCSRALNRPFSCPPPSACLWTVSRRRAYPRAISVSAGRLERSAAVPLSVADATAFRVPSARAVGAGGVFRVPGDPLRAAPAGGAIGVPPETAPDDRESRRPEPSLNAAAPRPRP